MDEKNPIDAAFERIRKAGNVSLYFKGDEFGPGVYTATLEWWEKGSRKLAEATGESPAEVLSEVWAGYEKAHLKAEVA